MKRLLAMLLVFATLTALISGCAASKKDEVIAMRTLARDCFVDGDKELVDDESLFLFGLMGQLSELITTRQSVLVNL